MATLEIKGGDKLNGTLAAILVKLDKAGSLRVGFLEGATYPDDGKPVAQIAAIQEFGAPAAGIPPRPFFRNMIVDKSPGWGVRLGKIAVAAGYDMKVTLGRMGEMIKGQLQRSIGDLYTPPLAPATIERKGFSKPLIESGHMQNSVDYEVNSS